MTLFLKVKVLESAESNNLNGNYTLHQSETTTGIFVVVVVVKNTMWNHDKWCFFYFSKEWIKQSVNSDTLVCVCVCVCARLCGLLGSLILFPWSWIAYPSGSVTELKTKHNWWSNTNVLQLWFSIVEYIYIKYTKTNNIYIYGFFFSAGPNW